MIKRPDEIVEIIKKIDDAGYDVCYAGQCIVSALMGETPLDWDMYTDCPQEKIREMFPDGEVLGKRMTRLDQSTFVKSDDLNVADHYDGVVVDIVTLEEVWRISLDSMISPVRRQPSVRTVRRWTPTRDVRI